MNTEIIEHNEGEIAALDNQPMSQYDRLLEMSIQKDSDLSQIEKLIDLKIKYDNEQARKAFTNDFALFKVNAPKVYKDLENKQYNSSYSSIGNTVNIITEALAPYGFAVRWEYKTTESSAIKVTCIISHKLGHSESCEAIGPPDSSGKKNSLQEVKSTRTYLKLETFEAVTGTASEFVNLNDDGNSACKEIEYITEEKQEIIISMIKDNGIDFDLFMKWAKLEDVSKIPSDKFSKYVSKINISIKNKSKKAENENS